MRAAAHNLIAQADGRVEGFVVGMVCMAILFVAGTMLRRRFA